MKGLLLSLFLFCLAASSSFSLAETNATAPIIATFSTKLMKDPVYIEKVKQIQTMNDADYDEFRKVVLQALINDRLVDSSEVTYQDIHLGDDPKHGLLVESSGATPLRLFINADGILVNRISGGKKLQMAFTQYLNDLDDSDALNAFLHKNGGRHDLAFLVASLAAERNSLAIDLDTYEQMHDPKNVMHITMSQGPNAGKEMIELSFNVKNSSRNVFPPPSVSFNNFGEVHFNPLVKIGAPENPEAKGACLRVGTCGKETCIDSTSAKSCYSQEVFGGAVRCPVEIRWHQNLKCALVH